MVLKMLNYRPPQLQSKLPKNEEKTATGGVQYSQDQ